MPGTGRLRLSSLGSEPGGGTQRRVVIMGSARVGKSSLISRLLYDELPERYHRTVEELHRAEFDSTLTLDILDTSGAFQFPAMRALALASGDAFLLVFSVDDAASWEEVVRLHEQVVEARGPNVPIVVAANKTDLTERVVTQEQAQGVAALQWGCGYVECSARDNVGVVAVFQELLVQARVRYDLSPAVRRRRQSLPSYVGSRHKPGAALKRNSCTVA